MTIELLATVIASVAVVISGYWAISKLVVTQFEKRLDERFDAQEKARVEGRRFLEKRIADIESDHRTLERTVLKEYMRREDHIRFETVISAKVDSVAAKVDLVAERLQQKRE